MIRHPDRIEVRIVVERDGKRRFRARGRARGDVPAGHVIGDGEGRGASQRVAAGRAADAAVFSLLAVCRRWSRA